MIAKIMIITRSLQWCKIKYQFNGECNIRRVENSFFVDAEQRQKFHKISNELKILSKVNMELLVQNINVLLDLIVGNVLLDLNDLQKKGQIQRVGVLKSNHGVLLVRKIPGVFSWKIFQRA